MSAHISDKHLAKLYRLEPRSVSITQLRRLVGQLKGKELALLAHDATTRLPIDTDEARALIDALLQLPTEVRIDARCIAALTHAADLAKGKTFTSH